jgi:hypothetical protein
MARAATATAPVATAPRGPHQVDADVACIAHAEDDALHASTRWVIGIASAGYAR